MSTSILTQRDRCGPYRVSAPRLASLLGEAEALALPVVRCAPAAAAAPAEWLAALGQALALPAHFGANFDALYDCLCDREVLSHNDLLLVLGKLEPLGESGSDTLIAVLQAAADEWREQGRALWACFDVPGLDLDPLPNK